MGIWAALRCSYCGSLGLIKPVNSLDYACPECYHVTHLAEIESQLLLLRANIEVRLAELRAYKNQEHWYAPGYGLILEGKWARPVSRLSWVSRLLWRDFCRDVSVKFHPTLFFQRPAIVVDGVRCGVVVWEEPLSTKASVIRYLDALGIEHPTELVK